ncbi:helix-turn-helix domain-containing protein [Methylobacterium sp. ID0610]|uniref:helix-turn-helix domain-containing protein n=1 Tax=Methylobacterium carpenticola TaxID=3344827 RepID=UPI0036910EA5
MAGDRDAIPDIAMDRSDGTGRKLRQRRMIKGLSLQQVAERAEISVGLLSQIERGLTAPSLRSLRQVCAALDMPVGWLFDVPASEHDDVVVRAGARRTLDLGPKGLRKELMSPDAVSGIQMMRMVIRPGGGSGESTRNEAGAKCGTVLSGTLALDLAGVVHLIHAGDSFAFEATTPHRYWCVGDEAVDFFWVVSPAVY